MSGVVRTLNLVRCRLPEASARPTPSRAKTSSFCTVSLPFCFSTSLGATKELAEALTIRKIWRWPGRYFEAEHHAVWRTPQGALVDVTPQTGNPPRILFLPDPPAIFDPARYRRNIMAPDAGNSAAAEYIALADRRRNITDRYWQPGMLVWPLFSPEDQARLAPIDARMAELLAGMRAG